jgi:hypothetical protein
MTSVNLSRRAILAGIATASLVALPAMAAAAPATVPLVAETPAVPDAISHQIVRLFELGQQLKAASARVAECDARGLYEAIMETADFGDLSQPRTPEQIAAAHQRFEETAKQNGYYRVKKKWNAASRVEAKIARAILRIPSTGHIGDRIRAAAALVLDSPDLENGFKARELLWEIAVRDGFTPPVDLVRKFRRKGILIAAKSAPKAVQS